MSIYGNHFASVRPCTETVNLEEVFMQEMNQFDSIVNSLSILSENTEIIYEAKIDRIKRLCQMSIAGIKDTSAVMQPIYLEQYEKCIKELTEVEKFGKSSIVTIQKFVNTVISSPSVFIDNLLTGRINKEYFTLQNQVEELINNKLYYYGNKFKSYLK